VIKVSDLLTTKRKLIQLPAKVRFNEDEGFKCLERMPVRANKGIVYLNSMRDNDVECFCTFVTDKNSNVLGHHKYSIVENVLEGDYMEVDCRYQGNGLGELLRLASLMMCKENNLEAIKLDALSTAIPFHLKYKFKPYFPFYKQETILNLLQNIIYRTNESGDLNKLAKKLSSDYYIAKDENSYQESLCNLITRYVVQNRGHWDDMNFVYNLRLKLDNNMLKSNADYYNKLFKKHDIDYRI